MTDQFVDAGAEDGDRVHADYAARPLAAVALRLVSSVQDWAQDWARDWARDWAQQNLGESTDGQHSSECHWCPLCQFVSVLRGERPEVSERVAEAGTAVAAALRALVETASGAPSDQPRHARAAPAPRVQKITLNEES